MEALASGIGASVAARRVAVVTGASSGVGRATTLLLARQGWNLVLGARREDALAEVATQARAAGAGVHFARLDLADERSITSFHEESRRAFGRVDALVSNAGATTPGLLVDMDPERMRDTFQVNALGPLLHWRLLIGDWMRAQVPGHIVLVSSEQVARECPYLLPYGASKIAMEYVARGLRRELHDTQIRTSVVRIGSVDTEFRRHFDPGVARRMVEAWVATGIPKPSGNRMTPESVAVIVAVTLSAPEDLTVELLDARPTGAL